MEDVKKAPQYVQKCLLEGENVLVKISAGRADLYATDKRLLRFRNKLTFDIWEYDKLYISSFNGMDPRIPPKLLGYLGLFGVFLGTVVYVGSPPAVQSSCLLFLSVSVLLIVFAIVSSSGYYQVEYASLDGKTAEKLRIIRTLFNTRKVMKFVNVVQEKTRKDKSDYWLGMKLNAKTKKGS